MKYPWDDWFARTKFLLVQGEDYNCGSATMVQQVRNQASRRGVGVDVAHDIVNNDILVKVRPLDLDDGRVARRTVKRRRRSA